MEEKKVLFKWESFRCYLALCTTLVTAALVPFLGAIALFMIPSVLIYCRFSLTPAAQAVVSFLSLATTFAAVNLTIPQANLLVVLSLFISGIAMSEIILKRYPIEKTILLSSSILLFTGLAFLIFHAISRGYHPWELVERYVKFVVQENIRLYEMLNVPADQLAALRENTAEIVSFFTAITPALSASASLIVVWINIMAARRLLKSPRLLSFPDFGDLSRWKAPDNLVWLLIISAASTLIADGLVFLFGINMLIISCVIYFLQGLSIASYFFRHKGFPAPIRYLFYFLLAIQHYLVILVVMIGLFDLWIDFRRRISKVTDGNA